MQRETFPWGFSSFSLFFFPDHLLGIQKSLDPVSEDYCSHWVTYGCHIHGPPKDCSTQILVQECLVLALQFPFCPLVVIPAFTVLSPSVTNSSCCLLKKHFWNIIVALKNLSSCFWENWMFLVNKQVIPKTCCCSELPPGLFNQLL